MCCTAQVPKACVCICVTAQKTDERVRVCVCVRERERERESVTKVPRASGPHRHPSFDDGTDQ